MTDGTQPLLSKIHSPRDLNHLSLQELEALAAEIRALIIDVVRRNGGHLASNLGAVELTLALHRVFDSPRDRIIWDVGHQCYAHKILTGRLDAFGTIRTLGGLSGFPKCAESEHDVVETGHASTSISSALGVLEGQRLLGREGKVIAVIGDGALTGGQALEALNQAAELARDLVIVLNDNAMSISPNVGAMSSYLSRLTTTTAYQSLRKLVDETVRRIPVFGEDLTSMVRQLERGARAAVLPETLFSDFGFQYVGPLDGHSIEVMSQVMSNVRRMDRPVLVHVRTVKGRGYTPAEENPSGFHGVSPFSKGVSSEALVDGKVERKGGLRFSEAFSRALVGRAEQDERVVGISAAMTAGTGMTPFAARFPGRFYDVGITEPHAVTFSSGLARTGLRPVVAIYSTFMQRAVDQVIHDVALPGLPVIMALDRAGIVGEDGDTHHGVFDIALFRNVPGLTFMAPATAGEMEMMLEYGLALDGPSMIRYPRSRCCEGGCGGAEAAALAAPLEPGRGVLVRRGPERPTDVKAGGAGGVDAGRADAGGRALLISVGGMLEECLEVADRLAPRGVSCDVYNLRFIRPLDEEHLAEVIGGYAAACVVEEGVASGGIGEHIAALAARRGVRTPVAAAGVPDRFIQHGKRRQLMEMCGLDAAGIAERLEAAMRDAGALAAQGTAGAQQRAAEELPHHPLYRPS